MRTSLEYPENCPAPKRLFVDSDSCRIREARGCRRSAGFLDSRYWPRSSDAAGRSRPMIRSRRERRAFRPRPSRPALMERINDCITKPSGSEPICPKGSIDIPCVRLAPPSGGCFLIDRGPPTVCQTVLCGPEYSVGASTPFALPQTSVGLATDCCGGAGGPVPGGGGPCSGGPWTCECCQRCGPCPPEPYADPAVAVLPCVSCTNSAFPPGGLD